MAWVIRNGIAMTHNKPFAHLSTGSFRLGANCAFSSFIKAVVVYVLSLKV